MKRTSYKVALGGIVSAVCVLMMFMTGVVPFATYLIPALCGFVITIVMVEINTAWSLVTFFSVAFLSLLIAPDKEAAVIFTMFLGYYPSLKVFIEAKLKSKAVQYVVKFIIFNVAIVLAYQIIIHVFGLTEVMEDFGDFGKYGAYILLGMGNFTFLVLDMALVKLIDAYINWFRPKFLRKNK